MASTAIFSCTRTRCARNSKSSQRRTHSSSARSASAYDIALSYPGHGSYALSPSKSDESLDDPVVGERGNHYVSCLWDSSCGAKNCITQSLQRRFL